MLSGDCTSWSHDEHAFEVTHVTQIQEVLCGGVATFVFITATHSNHQSRPDGSAGKGLGAKPDDLSPILWTHVAGENPLLQAVF